MGRITRARLAVALTALLAAQTGASAQEITTTQDRALAQLQAKLAANPTSVKALRAVGLKLYELGRFQDARPVLAQGQQLAPKDGIIALYSGMAAEQAKDFAAAKTAYGRYLEVGKTKKVRDQISARLVAMAKDELKEQARQAVANEQALRGTQVPGTTVAVLPFRCSCADTALLPLERGMADLVVSDLSRSSAIRVLERDRMQAIADEIRLAQTAQVDAGTAARAGKLIAAGRILNGQILQSAGAQRMDLAGSVVNTNNSSVESNPSAQGTINALFDLEKTFVLNVFQQMGVVLTVAERQQLETRRVPTLQAFLAYSRGLMAEDAGRLDDAVRFFESARTLDPGFSQALVRAQSAAAARTGAAVTSATVTQGLRNSAEGQVVAAANRGSTDDVSLNLTLNNVVGDVNPTTTNTVQNNTNAGGGSNNGPGNRDAASEKTSSDQPAQRTGQLTIVIKKP
jgi:tetratricopeptide (TPR) repeat protein